MPIFASSDELINTLKKEYIVLEIPCNSCVEIQKTTRKTRDHTETTSSSINICECKLAVLED
jgi:hypothetical protein